MTKAFNSTDIVATNLTTFSNADPDHPAQFTHRTYKLTLTLIDQASNQSATLTFTGEFNGQLTSTSSNILNSFLGATSFSVVLGKHRYTVTMDSYAPPGRPVRTTPAASPPAPTSPSSPSTRRNPPR